MNNHELDCKIKKVVKDNRGITTVRISSILSNKDISEESITRRVWALIDYGVLSLTDDCGIELSSKKRLYK